jgi:hypothetical protein
MDKIPEALQHKIDYINALDIPARQKAERIATSTIDYWAAYYRWQQWSGHEDKGLKPAKNPPPMPPVKSPKRDIKVSIFGINPEDAFTAESIAQSELLKEINSFGVQPSVPWPRNATDPTGPPNARPSPPPMPPKRIIKDEKFQDQNKPDQFSYQLSCCLWVGAFVLCGGIGLVLGVAFGGSL